MATSVSVKTDSLGLLHVRVQDDDLSAEREVPQVQRMIIAPDLAGHVIDVLHEIQLGSKAARWEEL